MTVLDIGNNVTVTQHSAPDRLSATAATPTAQDLSGCTYGIVVINMGDKDGVTSVWTYTIEDSPDNVTFTTVKKQEDGEVSTDDATYQVDADGENCNRRLIIPFDTTRVDRYLRVTCVKSGGGSDSFDQSVTIVTMPNYTGDADAPSFSI